jgi:Zn finger protein HypA/HybF involved in hydrogenase expression
MSDLELTMMRRVGELNKENARLKAEVERLDTLCKQVMAQHSDISCENIMLRKANDQLAEVRELHAGFNRALFNETVTENARLKAEVEQLMIFCNCTLIPNKELQAEVERLTNAGDTMANVLCFTLGLSGEEPRFVKDWNAAKEGKGQS